MIYLGTNLGLCISDLLVKKVKTSQVFAIISNNMFDISDRSAIHDWYMTTCHQHTITQHPAFKLHEYEEPQVIDVFLNLVNCGIILTRDHSTRFNTLSNSLNAYKIWWYSMNLVPDSTNEAVREAWDEYIVLEKLFTKNLK